MSIPIMNLPTNKHPITSNRIASPHQIPYAFLTAIPPSLVVLACHSICSVYDQLVYDLGYRAHVYLSYHAATAFSLLQPYSTLLQDEVAYVHVYQCNSRLPHA